MTTFTKVAAQGEITIIKLSSGAKAMPAGYTKLEPEGLHLIVGHSETGHHHVIDRRHASVAVKEKAPEGMRILRMIVSEPTKLEHLRPYDTHEAIALDPGVYELRIGREYDPYAELARQSAD
jgi:hypothetical protein